MFPMKEQDKNLVKELNKIDINSLPDNEFYVMVIKMFTHQIWVKNESTQ